MVATYGELIYGDIGTDPVLSPTLLSAPLTGTVYGELVYGVAEYGIINPNVFTLPVKPFAFVGYAPVINTGVSQVNPVLPFDLNFPLPSISAGVSISTVPRLQEHLVFPPPLVAAGVSLVLPVHAFTFQSGLGYFKVQLIKFTGDAVPLEHVQDAQKLQADAYVDLFQIVLSDKISKLYLKQSKTVLWQGNTYEGTGIQIEGVAQYSDDEVARPKLTMFNPEGVYSYLIDKGLIDNATIVRYRVLKTHIDNDIGIYRRQQWRVSRIANIKSNFIILELRDMLDGQNFLTPGRMFIPPDFPTVSLQ